MAEYLGAVFLLDKYHINKCITESLAFCPELRIELLQAVRAFDLKAVNRRSTGEHADDERFFCLHEKTAQTAQLNHDHLAW
ncbi:MAG: hypothetical protein ACOX3I_02460 [Limnochordia bacterium]